MYTFLNANEHTRQQAACHQLETRGRQK